MELSKLVETVRCRVNNNDHGGAYQAIAESLGEKELAEAFARINKEHLRVGHLPFELYEARHFLYQQLMSCARKRLGEESFQQLRGAL